MQRGFRRVHPEKTDRCRPPHRQTPSMKAIKAFQAATLLHLESFSMVHGLACHLAQCLSQEGQHGGITLVLALHVIHVPQHPHHMPPVARLLQGAQPRGQTKGLYRRRTHNHNAPCAQARSSGPEGVGMGHKAILTGRGHGWRCGRFRTAFIRQAGGPERMRTGRVGQILKQFLQKNPALHLPLGLSIAQVKPEVPVGPQHKAGARLFKLPAPGRGPEVGSQGFPQAAAGRLCALAARDGRGAMAAALPR